jgi:hypothetical protein
MSGRMTIPANTRRPRQRKPLLRPDDVHNALSFVLHSEILEAEILHVGGHLEDLRSTRRLLDEGLDVQQRRSIGGGHVVIHRGQSAVGSTDGAVGEAEALEGLGGGHFVD